MNDFDEKQVELNKFMITFDKIPTNTNFCHCREGLICEQTSRGIGT